MRSPLPIRSFTSAGAIVQQPLRYHFARLSAPTFAAKFAADFATKSSPAPASSGKAASHQLPEGPQRVGEARNAKYDRLRDLPGLLPLWPAEIADDSLAARQRIVVRLRSALREERRRGLAGHWTYNLARHAALFRAYKYELACLEAATA